MLLDEFDRWLRTPRERQPIAESLAMPDGFMAAIVAGPATYEPLVWLSPAQATHRQAIPSSGCRATINMRTRVNQDENPVWGEAVRA